MSQLGSVSVWLDELKRGNSDAAQQLWERYYQRLVALARHRLGDSLRTVADEDDVVVSAFQSFFYRAQEGKFPQLSDRNDLWSLLVVITARKAINQVNYQRRAKRGGGRPPDDFLNGVRDGDEVAMAQIVGKEPTPEFAVQCAELFQTFMDTLSDPTFQSIANWKFEGRTNAEIAQQLDCSLSTVERKLRIIRKRMIDHWSVS